MISLHLFLVILTLFVVVYSDHKAFLWFTGKIKFMDNKITNICHKLALWGFLLICLSGFWLFWPMKDFLLSDKIFIWKMIFVVVLGINGLLIGKLSHYAIEKSFLELDRVSKIKLLFSGFLSTLGWVMSIILGYLIF